MTRREIMLQNCYEEMSKSFRNSNGLVTKNIKECRFQKGTASDYEFKKISNRNCSWICNMSYV